MRSTDPLHRGRLLPAAALCLQPATAPRPLPALMGLLMGLLLALTAATPAHAQWKWRDATGRITVSDRPPPREVADKDILQRPFQAQRRDALEPSAPAASAASAPPAARPAPPSVDRDLEARKRAAEQEKAAKAKAEENKLAAQRADNCRRARSHLATLESGQRMARINEKGEREIIDDKTRAEEMRTVREVMSTECR
jgi:hypothetical protein